MTAQHFCPNCHIPMIWMEAQRGPFSGQWFWVCKTYGTSCPRGIIRSTPTRQHQTNFPESKKKGSLERSQKKKRGNKPFATWCAKCKKPIPEHTAGRCLGCEAAGQRERCPRCGAALVFYQRKDVDGAPPGSEYGVKGKVFTGCSRFPKCRFTKK